MEEQIKNLLDSENTNDHLIALSIANGLGFSDLFIIKHLLNSGKSWENETSKCVWIHERRNVEHYMTITSSKQFLGICIVIDIGKKDSDSWCLSVYSPFQDTVSLTEFSENCIDWLLLDLIKNIRKYTVPLICSSE